MFIYNIYIICKFQREIKMAVLLLSLRLIINFKRDKKNRIVTSKKEFQEKYA